MSRTVPRTAALLLVMALSACAAPSDPLAQLVPPEALPQPSGSFMNLGRRLLAANRPVQAEQAFIRSMRVEGMTAAALTGAGVAAQRQGLLTEAMRFFERARDLDPASVAAHNNLGAALFGLGELRSAQHAFRTAFALSSGDSREAAQNLGMVELAIAEADAAEPDALAGDPRGLHRTGSSVYRLSAEPADEG